MSKPSARKSERTRLRCPLHEVRVNEETGEVRVAFRGEYDSHAAAALVPLAN
jgi:hypothetical protein